MVDSADIYFIQHFADIYFSKSICISACRGYQVSRTYCQVSFSLFLHKNVFCWYSLENDLMAILMSTHSMFLWRTEDSCHFIILEYNLIYFTGGSNLT